MNTDNISTPEEQLGEDAVVEDAVVEEKFEEDDFDHDGLPTLGDITRTVSARSVGALVKGEMSELLFTNKSIYQLVIEQMGPSAEKTRGTFFRVAMAFNNELDLTGRYGITEEQIWTYLLAILKTNGFGMWRGQIKNADNVLRLE